MKRHVLSLLFLVSVAAGPAQAQSAPPPAPADAAPVAAPPPPYQKVVEGRTIIDYAAPPSRNDPRVCLAFATNAQVIACAEKFRLDRRRAQ